MVEPGSLQRVQQRNLELRADFEKEYEETLAPLDEARRAIGDTLAGEERTPPSTEDDAVSEDDSERDDT